MASPWWNATLANLLGAPVSELTPEHLRQLVTDKVRETDGLDFQATPYAKDDERRIELCKDIAAPRNDRGGVIVRGVGEKDGVANWQPAVTGAPSSPTRCRNRLM